MVGIDNQFGMSLVNSNEFNSKGIAFFFLFHLSQTLSLWNCPIITIISHKLMEIPLSGMIPKEKLINLSKSNGEISAAQYVVPIRHVPEPPASWVHIFPDIFVEEEEAAEQVEEDEIVIIIIDQLLLLKWHPLFLL